MHLSVFAHGIDGVAVRVLDPAVPVSKWPDYGATLPVEVAAHNPRKVRVLWDKVVTHAQAAGEDLYPDLVNDEDAARRGEYERGAYPPDEYGSDGYRSDEYGSDEYGSDGYRSGRYDDDATLTNLPPVPPAPPPASARGRGPAPAPARTSGPVLAPARRSPVEPADDSAAAPAPEPASAPAPASAPISGPASTPAAEPEPVPAAAVAVAPAAVAPAAVAPAAVAPAAVAPAAAPEPARASGATAATRATGTRATPSESGSRPTPRSRPSPHPRPRPAPDDRQAAGANPTYMREAPKHPPPDWPLPPNVIDVPVRPESRPEPDDVEIVTGTVEPGLYSASPEVVSGTIVDDFGRRYADRSETDRMTIDRTAIRILDPIDADPIDVEPLRAQPMRAWPTFAQPDNTEPVHTEPVHTEPVPAEPTATEPTATEPTATEPTATEPTATTDAADTPGASPDRPDSTAEGFAAEPARFLAAPSAGMSQLGAVGGFSITLFVRELARSIAFYRDILGLGEVDMGRGSAVLSRGEARILLKRVTDLQPVDRRIVHLNLEVPDVHAAYEELRAKGVQFVHKPRVVSQGEQLELWAATFRDPDGHAIALTRWELRR
jgi:catechol 2,3-dioxygenase-like lactoylglutathione lyase family enzyme